MIGKKLNKVFSSKVFFIVFALILSVVLWMYVEINENQDMEKTIEFDSFVFLNEDIFNDRNFFITSMDPENVSLKIECPRLVAKSLDKNTVSLTVDLSKITSEGYTPLSYSVVYPNGVDTSQIRNQTKSVESIAFNVDIRKEREIRVEVPYNGGTASSELLAKAPEFEPQTITVSGPESVISRIRAAVVPIMRERLETTYVDDLPFILVDENDEELDETAVSTLKFSHDRIHVTIPVSTVKTVALTVNYIYGAGATANNIRDVIDPPFVTISGDPDAIADYNSIQLSTIDLTTFDYSNTYSFPIAIQNGFVNESGETEALVSVQVLGVAIEHFSVTALHTVKTPPGLIPTVITQSVDVKVRGKPDDLAKITPSNIMIVADLTDYSPGTSVIPAKVRFDSDIVGDFGAIDEYSLTVRLDRS